MILVIALLLTVAIPVSANEILLSFQDGNEYLELSESEKLFYVEGLADMLGFLFYLYDIEKHKKLVDKMENIRCDQMVKIYNKYLEEHPEDLHYMAAYTYFEAINEIIFKE